MADFIFDTAAMTSLKGSFTQEASTIAGLISTLTGQVNNVIDVGYKGPAATRFKGAWDSEFRPALTRLQTALEEAATEIQKRLDAGQSAAS